MKVLGSIGFYSCYIKNLHVDSQPFSDQIKYSTPFHWTEEHEQLFNSIKERFHKDTVLAVPSTDYPFHIHVDSSNVGNGCILIQEFPEGKRNISFKYCVFDKAEQKMSTLHQEPCGIASALQTYEYYIIGSPFSTYLCCDHKPNLYLWGRKGQLSHRYFRYQVIISPSKLEDHLDFWLELSFSRYTQQKCHAWRISDAPTATQTYSARHWVLRRTRHSSLLKNPTWRQSQWYLQRFLPNQVQAGQWRKNTEITKRRRGLYRQ